MPLVRYEIRNEYSLANPQLYRTAATDDPEGLLEGVAMAGLVGIVRQLGDLAEFAAEVFRDLHEEVMAVASRGHELLVRVQQLEAEMPSVEKALLSETNQLRFAYTPGVEWHASIRNDQNHCTQGDLPRFIRTSYEECRGPPRLFLLDKFDVAGAGACLKRYTDPSFFRTEWASSELMKAERAQRDKMARKEKKKGRRRRSVDAKDSRLVDPYQQRFSHELSRDLAQHDPHSRNWHESVSQRMDKPLEQDNVPYNENVSAISRHLAEAQAAGQDRKSRNAPQGFAEESFNKDYAKSVEPILSEASQSNDYVKQRTGAPTVYFKDLSPEEKPSSVTYSVDTPVESKRDPAYDVDDVASEGEQFMDALTTMESEVDTDSDTGFKQDREVNGDRSSVERVDDTTEAQATLSEGLNSPTAAEPAAKEVTIDESAPPSIERVTADDDFPKFITKSEKPPVQMASIVQEDRSVPPPVQRPYQEETQSSRSGLGSPARAQEELGTRHYHVPVMQWNGSTQQHSPKSQDYPLSPKFDQVPNEGFSKTASPRIFKAQSPAGPDLIDDSNFQSIKQDVNGSTKITSSAHMRKKSTDSVISTASRKFYRGESMEDSRENLAAVPKLSIFKNDSRSTSMRVEHDDAPSPLGAAMKVSKMVAAFEAGSLEQIQGMDRREEPRSNGLESSPREDAAASFNTGNGRNGSYGHPPKLDVTSVQDSYSPAVESPASETSNSTNGLPATPLPQPPKLRVEISSSSRLSVGSVDSPPRSPIFSALHSPMSPVRTSRNILSSPDSPGLGFSSTLLLSPSSPTFVPILDSSPTSKRVPPSIFSRNRDSEFQVHSPTVMDNPFESPSILPAEPLPTQTRHHSAFMSPAHLNMLHDGPRSSTMPYEDWSSHFSPSPLASPRDGVPTPPADDALSQRRWPVDKSEELESRVSTQDGAHTVGADEEEHSSPGTPHGVEHTHDDEISSQISPRSVVNVSSRDFRGSPEPESLFDTEPLPDNDLTKENAILRVRDDEDEILEKEESVRQDSEVPATSPVPSVSHQVLTSPLSAGGHVDDSRPARAETSRVGTIEQAQQEMPRKLGARATHKRFPSQPPLEMTSQEFSLPFMRTSIYSRGPRVSRGSGLGPGEHEPELPSRSPPMRPVDDSPFLIPRGTHRRHPSFPTSQRTTLDFAPTAHSRRLEDLAKESAFPVQPVPNVGVQPSKRPHTPPSSSRPSEKLHPLPIPSPPSSSKRQIASPPPLPFQTLHELPPPPPPSRSPPPLTGSKVAASGEALLDAIASHDKSTLKKVKTMQNPTLRRGDDRTQMLEQIRAQSFNLRHTVTEKFEPPLPRPVTNINVAAILEKANAIRQAFAGSDEDDEDDDEWSDT